MLVYFYETYLKTHDYNSIAQQELSLKFRLVPGTILIGSTDLIRALGNGVEYRQSHRP